MKQFLILSIDVEPDCTPSWTYSNPLSFTGVSVGIKQRLQPLFDKYEIVPTYLVNNVVLENEESVAVFKTLSGRCELGTHLHPEFIEPQKQFHEYAGRKGEANCCFYPPELEFAKIDEITRLFVRKFDFAPRSFRAGRFSAGLNTISSLRKLGYLVDTSVTPNVRWDDRTREKPVDFRHAPGQPYWISESSMVESGENQSLLEAPVTIIREKLSLVQAMKYTIRNKRLPYKRSRALWLRPVFSGIRNLEKIMESTYQQNAEAGIVVYNMMFHNVEVMPGLSPYSKTETDCQQYLGTLEWLFNYCKQKNILSISLSELHEKYNGK
ncbi:MAG TPA: hypothetical protein VK618_13435 [Flavitalea sp.]|nr:hypothetical protein [Flavitalea sp.]